MFDGLNMLGLMEIFCEMKYTGVRMTKGVKDLF